MGCQSDIAEKVVDFGSDYLLATENNQKTAHSETQLYFYGVPESEVETLAETEKCHGRIETRRHLVSHAVDWTSGKRRYPDELHFNNLRTIAMIETRIEAGGTVKAERRCYISSRALKGKVFAKAVHAHCVAMMPIHHVLACTRGNHDSLLPSAVSQGDTDQERREGHQPMALTAIRFQR